MFLILLDNVFIKCIILLNKTRNDGKHRASGSLVGSKEMGMVILKRLEATGFISAKAKVQTMPSGLHIAYISSRFKGEIEKMKKSGWVEY